ncbi:MAG: hypothetical protein ACKOA8_04305, partial [Deltaproteobacteria bacterium]
MKRLFQILCLSFLLGPKLTLSAPESARNIIHLLSYIASDYSGAVQNGKVVSTSEYEEQVEFSKSVVDMAKVDSEMNLHPEILKSLEALRGLIIHKSSAEKVRETVEQSQNLIFKISSV